MIKRRLFLSQVAVLAAAGLSLPSCRKPRSRGEVLSGLVHDVLAADIKEIVVASEHLDRAVQKLVTAPAPETLSLAQKAWKGAVTRWKRGYCYRNGPLVETAALLRAAFWPTRQQAIDAFLSKPLPEGDYFSELGVDVKGLYALEYLLFGIDKTPPVEASRFAGPDADRTRRFTGALARDVRLWSEKADTALGDGTKLAARLAGGDKDTLSFFVNQMAATAESVGQQLSQASDLAKNGRLRPREIEAWPSGMSTDILDTLIAGTEHLYAGKDAAGLAELVAAVAPQLEPRIRAAFSHARATLRGLDGPVEEAALARPAALTAARDATKALEISLKTEFASALGVTLTFTSTDGD
jgi:predicted lipoprotein